MRAACPAEFSACVQRLVTIRTAECARRSAVFAEFHAASGAFALRAGEGGCCRCRRLRRRGCSITTGRRRTVRARFYATFGSMCLMITHEARIASIGIVSRIASDRRVITGRRWRRRVHRLRRMPDRTRAHICILHVIDFLRRGAELASRGIHFCVRMRRCELSFEIRRARFALTCLSVPTNLRAHPKTAISALAKMPFALLDRSFERRVVRRPADGALHFVSAVPRAGDLAAKDASRRAQKCARGSDDRSLKAGHETVAALVAIKVELVAAVGRQILVIFGECDQRHRGCSLALF